MILFGVRSPLVVEYEETCLRLGLEITAAVSLGGAPRLAGRPPVVELADFDPKATTDRFVACAFAPSRRAELIAQGRALGLRLAPALVDPHAVLASSVRVRDGSFINAATVIGAVSVIGQGVLVNRAASIGHHAMIGDYVSIGPGATLAGNVHVGEAAMIGAGSVILPNLRIGAGAIIAAGSLVRKDVPDETFVAGNPAVEKPYDRARSSLHIEDQE
jgi:sugar O-acyltransferase (sialic acid O-acetyltransferase NeuD family)